MTRKNTWLLIIGAVVIVGAFVVPLDSARAQAAAAVATAITAIAAMVSAFGSADAARSSQQAATDAVRALSLAGKPVIKPTFFIDLDGRRLLEIENASTVRVKRASVSWALEDGPSGSFSIGPLAANTFPTLRSQSPEWVHQQYVPELDVDTGSCFVTVAFQGETGQLVWRNRYRLPLGMQGAGNELLSEEETSESDVFGAA